MEWCWTLLRFPGWSRSHEGAPQTTPEMTWTSHRTEERVELGRRKRREGAQNFDCRVGLCEGHTIRCRGSNEGSLGLDIMYLLVLSGDSTLMNELKRRFREL